MVIDLNNHTDQNGNKLQDRNLVLLDRLINVTSNTKLIAPECSKLKHLKFNWKKRL